MSLRALNLAEKAVTEISRGTAGLENIRPNAVRITQQAIIEGANQALDAAARAIRLTARRYTDLTIRQTLEEAARAVQSCKTNTTPQEEGPRVA